LLFHTWDIKSGNISVFIGTVSRDFLPLNLDLQYFRNLYFLKICENFRYERCTTGVIDTGGIYIDRSDTDRNLPTVSMTPPAVNLPLAVPVVNIDHSVKLSTP
jgi:hypothetical protein